MLAVIAVALGCASDIMIPHGIISAVRIIIQYLELAKHMMLTELKREIEIAGERLTRVRDYL